MIPGNIMQLDNVHYEVEAYVNGNKVKKQILKEISFSLKEKNILGVTGESGSGKTTLAKIIAGLIKPTGGKIHYSNKLSDKNSRNRIQVLFQNNGDILNPFRTIAHMLDEAMKIEIADKNEREIFRQELIDAVDFSENLLDRKGFQLSGGEQQRAALMRLLAVKPELLILDEPFSAQDFESQISFLKLFKGINEKFGTTIICISHDILLLKALVDEVIVMYNGSIVESNSANNIFSFPAHPYTKFLLDANSLNLTKEELKKSF
ncbi:MAG: ATP-binding cassette domain-containing protein [Ignavibacteriales bacterium]|nr:MAG: ATP-binding cassette domain-containing protein [Ignavibacteriales bacterium]